MMKVELIYDNDFPHVKIALSNLLQAFYEVKIQPKWKEWSQSEPEVPAYVHAYASPTILVNSRDVTRDSSGPKENARENQDSQDVPSVEIIKSSLLKFSPLESDTGSSRKPKKKWQTVLASLVSIGVAFLPKIGCPACWPAYAGVLSSFGVPFVNYTPYLMPLLSIFLAIALFSLGFHARRRRGYKPFLLGILAAAIIIGGKFVFDFDQVMYGGVVLLMCASIWNSWPLKKSENARCPACESTITTADTTK